MHSSTDPQGLHPGLAEDLPGPEWLTDARGRRLAFSTYPAERPWLHVLISHGFGQHRGWWHHVALGLNAAGITAHTFDHFHHGRSHGRAADVPDYAVLVAGLRLALERGVAPRLDPGAPLALLGHSNGALVSLLALREMPGSAFAGGRLAGLVLASPLLRVPPVLWGWAHAAARVFKLIRPSHKVRLRFRPQLLTRNPDVWGEVERDPYRFRDISARFYLAMLRACRQARRRPSCQGLPLLLLCAGDEGVVYPPATRRWFGRVDSPDKQRIVYPDLRHELFNEREWKQVLSDTVAWLEQRFAPGR